MGAVPRRKAPRGGGRLQGWGWCCFPNRRTEVRSARANFPRRLPEPSPLRRPRRQLGTGFFRTCPKTRKATPNESRV